MRALCEVQPLKIIVDRKELLSAVNTAKAAVSNKSALPILGSLLLQAADGKLYVTGSNLAEHIRTWVACQVDVQGQCLCPAHRLAGLLAKTQTQDVVIESPKEGAVTTFKCGDALATMPGDAPDMFPPSPFGQGGYDSFSLDSDRLLEIINSVSFAMCNDPTRANLMCLRIEFGAEHATFVATNGHIVSVALAPECGCNTDIHGLSMPYTSVAKLTGLLRAGGQCTVYFSDTELACELGNATMVTRSMASTALKWKPIFGSLKTTASYLIGRAPLLGALERQQLMVDDMHMSCLMEFKGNTMQLSSSTPIGKYSEALALEEKCETPGAIALNPVYLSNVLRVQRSGVVRLQTAGKNAPVQVMEHDSDPPFEIQNVIMSIRQ